MPTLVNLHNMREEKRVTTGFHDIYGNLFDQVGYNKILKSSKVSSKIFKDIVMARLAKPVSKGASCELLYENFGIDYNLEQIYRMLDAIKCENKNVKKNPKVDKIPEIQKITFLHSKRLLNGKITLCFYDCTTLFFESFSIYFGSKIEKFEQKLAENNIRKY